MTTVTKADVEQAAVLPKLVSARESRALRG